MDSHPQSKPDFPIREARLRILATSDLHMHLLSFDYVKSCANKAGSLAKIATLIRQAREEAAAANEICLLIDNGDTWQGNPLADILARGGVRKLHPMTRAMNYLHYDAVGSDTMILILVSNICLTASLNSQLQLFVPTSRASL